MIKEPIVFSNPLITPTIPYSVRQYSLKQRTILRLPHRHEQFAELTYITAGAGIYFIDGKSYPIKEGDVLLYNKGGFHEVAPNKENTVYHICFGIAGLSLKGLPSGHMTRPEDGFIRPAGEKKEQIDTLVTMLYEIVQKKPSPLNTALSESLLKSLILLCVNMPPAEKEQKATKEGVIARNVLEYINMNFKEELTLEEIGHALNVSPYYAAHVFKNHFEISPIQYLIRCRLGEAQNLLISTEYPLEEVSALVGYNSCDHFKSIFKQKIGISPGKYRSYSRQDMIVGKHIQ